MYVCIERGRGGGERDVGINLYIHTYMDTYANTTTEGYDRACREGSVRFTFTETKKHSPSTGARASKTLQVTRLPHRRAC